MLAARSAVSVIGMAAILFGANIAWGQAYPSKPIRIFCSEVGSGTDITVRLIAPLLAAGLGQQVIVDNRPVVIGIEAAAKAPPDGYSLLISGPITWLLGFMRDNVSWDPERDFSPLTLVARSPGILAIHPSLPVKSVRELIVLARARPGDLNLATGALGGPPHLAAELFKSMAKINVVLVPYKGTGSAIIGLMGGEVQVMFPSPTSVAHHVKSGRLRALAVTSAEPSELVPGLPTVAASGLPGYVSESTYGLFAPARTPAPIVARLNEELVRVLRRADIREKLLVSGVGVVGSSPDEFAGSIKADMSRLGKVIRDAGVRVQ